MSPGPALLTESTRAEADSRPARAIPARELIYAGMLGAAALLLPPLFHIVHLGSVFLPMYLPLMTLAFLVGPGPAVITAGLVPLLSALTTGMPPWYPPVAPAMALELSIMAGLVSLWWRRRERAHRSEGTRTLDVLVVLVPVLLIGRLLQFGFGWGLGLLVDLPPAFLSVATLVSGLPGLVLMLIVIPGVVRLAPLPFTPGWEGSPAAGRTKRTAALQAWFDRRAADWDTLMPLERIHPALRLGLEELGVRPDERVLDLGCGTGVMTGVLLERLGPRGAVEAVDLAPAMLERARAKHPDRRVRFHQAEASEVPLPPESVDRILCYAAWPHFEDPDGVARELHRLLRPGGSLHVWHLDGRATIDHIHRQAGGPVGRHRLEPAARLAARLGRAGFTVTECRDEPDCYRVSAVRDGTP
jgi:ubiquinone/menaquinone biosynthesis C-methylase UbiE